MAPTTNDPRRGDELHRPVVERANATDRAFLSMDTGRIPEQFAVILMLRHGGDLELDQVRRLIGRRILGVPRLRQRLTRVALGGGGPIWRDDPVFDLARHVTAMRCPAPGDRQALLDTAMARALVRLPRSSPLWSATLITELADGDAALLLVVHHVLADGVGGLAVLGALVDPGAEPVEVGFPRVGPAWTALARDAWQVRLRALRDAPRTWQQVRRSMSAAGGVSPSRAAACSLLRRTGPRRAAQAVTVDRTALRMAAHRHGATTNDAVLVAVAAALARVLRMRGESIGTITVTVPVSGRRADKDAGRGGQGPALGNMVSPLLVEVTTDGPIGERLARVGEAVRTGKAAATGPPPIALLGWAFRPVARVGGFRWYMNHQHRFHTLVSHVRGPDHHVTFGGHLVHTAIPIGVGEGGNVTVHVEVLSYAGEITVTAVVDPDHFPEVAALRNHLAAELEAIVVQA
ncbi:MAG: wax ester/triacylglycerol synthase family O-acyltransferase [Kineosporiaceae bacterium]